jgi:hypothetical protein
MRYHNDGNDDRRWRARSRRWGKAPVAYDTNRRHRANSEEYPRRRNGRLRSRSVAWRHCYSENAADAPKAFKLARCPRSLAATLAALAFYVADPISSIETRSLSTLIHVLPPIRPLGFPIYVARVPAVWADWAGRL